MEENIIERYWGNLKTPIEKVDTRPLDTEVEKPDFIEATYLDNDER